MGADMVLAIAEMPHEPTRETVNELHDFVERLYLEDLELMIEVAMPAEGFESDEELLAEAKRLLHSDIEEIVAPLVDGNTPCDVVYSELGGKMYAFSGGPSWGDPPTEGFDQIARLDASGITRAPTQEGGQPEQ